MSLLKRLKAIQPIILVLFLAVFLRAWAVSLLPQDFDEPIYLQNAFDYAGAIRSGSIDKVIDYSGNSEHPAFVKLLYSSTILALGKSASWTNAFFASRAISALFGVLAVSFLALAIDPLAAGMLAVNTLAVKYTSQVYLEAVPHAMTIAAVLALLKTHQGVHAPDHIKPDRWFWLSSIALGISAASKYSYLPVILVVLGYISVFTKKIKIHWLLLYGILAVVVFIMLDIYLWHDTAVRLSGSLTYHMQYSQGQHVEEVGYPWFQPFIWILTSPPGGWHPNVFFYYGFDGLITILALSGVKREWKERRWLVIWFLAGLLFLLLWPTKWPQYALTVTPALCIMGAESLRRFIRQLRAQESYWNWVKEMVPKPDKWLWVAIGLFLYFIAAIYLSAAIKLAVGRVGWSNITHANSFLPSNTIYALLPLGNDQILIATEQGAALWTAAKTTDDEPSWQLFTSENTDLTDDHVHSLARDIHGNLWFGTADGVFRYDGDTWLAFRAVDLGLPGGYTLSLAASPDGRIYAGTLEGAAVWNGVTWSPLQQVEGQVVFSITSSVDGGTIWFGMDDGAGRLDVRQGEWSFLPADAPIKHILIDSHNTLWAATSGAGLAKLNGSAWTYFRTSNSEIPYNTVNWVAEVQPGILWVGTAMPTSTGGVVASFDGINWHSYLTNNSGSSGAEVTVIAVQSDHVWLGTRTAGIDMFNLGSEK